MVGFSSENNQDITTQVVSMSDEFTEYSLLTPNAAEIRLEVHKKPGYEYFTAMGTLDEKLTPGDVLKAVEQALQKAEIMQNYIGEVSLTVCPRNEDGSVEEANIYDLDRPIKISDIEDAGHDIKSLALFKVSSSFADFIYERDNSRVGVIFSGESAYSQIPFEFLTSLTSPDYEETGEAVGKFALAQFA